jgi:hypothetical protein
MDPSPDPDPTPFFSDFKNAKQNFFHIFHNFSADTLSSALKMIIYLRNFFAKTLFSNLQALFQFA